MRCVKLRMTLLKQNKHLTRSCEVFIRKRLPKRGAPREVFDVGVRKWPRSDGECLGSSPCRLLLEEGGHVHDDEDAERVVGEMALARVG